MNAYVVTLSKVFPTTHKRKGEPTNFAEQLLNAIWKAHNMKTRFQDLGIKLHTIRGNYELWEKRFKKIDEGKAFLSIRCWTGKPYHSKQVEICKLKKSDGISIQRLEFQRERGIWFTQYITERPIVRNTIVPIKCLAENDGLTVDDWREWFKSNDLSKPLAIIQFTKFRY